MRVPLIPTLLLVLATSFGGMAYAKDSLEDLSVQLSIVALKSTDHVGSDFKSTMLINGNSVPVTVSRDANGVLSISPVVGDDGKIAATDKNGKPVALDAATVPAKFQVTTSTNADGAIKVFTMTILAVNGKTVTYTNGAAGFAVTAGDATALAGITDEAAPQKPADTPAEHVTEIKVSKNETYVPQTPVISQESTTLTTPGNAANPSKSKQ